jgi:hypothetical protein
MNMGRGLSRYQKTILEEIKKVGSLTIYDVDDIVWRVKNRGAEDFSLLGALRKAVKGEVKDIRNFTALYKMMDGLVRKGLVGRVLHVRPTLWIALEEEKPTEKALQSRFKLMSLLMEGRLTVRVGDKVITYAQKA